MLIGIMSSFIDMLTYPARLNAQGATGLCSNLGSSDALVNTFPP